MNYKTIIAVFTFFVLVILGIKACQWVNKPSVSTTVASPDSTYKPATESNLRPTSVPFEHTTKPIVHEPNNVPQTDIAHTYRIIKTDSTGKKDTTSIVVLRNGNALVDNQDHKVTEFLEQVYVPPILSWDLHIKVGVDFNDKKVSPIVGLSFLRILGRVDVPVFSLDMSGIGIGADVQVLEPISVGVIYLNGFDTHKEIRLSVCYNF